MSRLIRCTKNTALKFAKPFFRLVTHYQNQENIEKHPYPPFFYPKGKFKVRGSCAVEIPSHRGDLLPIHFVASIFFAGYFLCSRSLYTVLAAFYVPPLSGFGRDCNDATIEESDTPMIMKSRKNTLIT